MTPEHSLEHLLRVPDFTEARYRAILVVARERFRFLRLTDSLEGSPIALWRHDIDFSPHRALALARIEADLGLSATYFVLLGSPFYNPFERETRNVLQQIATLGHDIGLHYDASLIDGSVPEHEAQIAFEAATLARWLDVRIRSFSLHNPTISVGTSLEERCHAGLVNATAPHWRNEFFYCSDSNGMWRYRALHEVILDPSIQNLYALTHAEWWTPEPLPPNARVERCIQGRAERVAADYRSFLLQHRPEVVDAT